MGPKRLPEDQANNCTPATEICAERHARTLRNRLAQRAYRERKDTRIKELEAEVSILKMQLENTKDVGPCLQCQSYKEITNQNQLIIKQLFDKVALLNKRLEATEVPTLMKTEPLAANPELQKFRNLCSVPSISSDISSLSDSMVGVISSTVYTELRPPTALELIGSPPMEALRQSLKLLPSLQSNPSNLKYVDILVDSFMKQATITDPKKSKRHIFLILNSRRRIIEICSLSDRFKVTELIEVAKFQNQSFVDFMYLYGTGVMPEGLDEMNTNEFEFSQDSPFRKMFERRYCGTDTSPFSFKETLRIIPSFSQGNADLLADECVAIMMEITKTLNKEERTELFFRTVALRKRLMDMCMTADDRISLQLAFDLGRIRDNSASAAFHDQLLADVDEVTSQY